MHCVRADVFGDLEIYVSEALAREHKLFFSSFSVGTFGGLAPPPPPPIPKSWLR